MHEWTQGQRATPRQVHRECRTGAQAGARDVRRREGLVLEAGALLAAATAAFRCACKAGAYHNTHACYWAHKAKVQKYKEISLGATSEGATTAEQAGKRGIHCGRTWGAPKGPCIVAKAAASRITGKSGNFAPGIASASTSAFSCERVSASKLARAARAPSAPPSCEPEAEVPASVPSELRSPRRCKHAPRAPC